MIYSKSITQLLEVIEETKKALILNVQLGRNIDESVIRASIRSGIHMVADRKDRDYSTIADKCYRMLETNAKGFEDLIIDHFSGGTDLADAACDHCKKIRGEDNPANIRAALKALQF